MILLKSLFTSQIYICKIFGDYGLCAVIYPKYGGGNDQAIDTQEFRLEDSSVNKIYNLIEVIEEALKWVNNRLNELNIEDLPEDMLPPNKTKSDLYVEDILKINDKVLWKHSWGSEPEKEAIVSGIQVCENDTKYGAQVKEIEWNKVKDRKVIVDLTNGHWAWAFQIRKCEE